MSSFEDLFGERARGRERMTRAEREEQAKLVRLRAKLAKADIDQRAAKLLADVEEQLAAKYKPDNKAWEDLSGTAQAQVDALDAELAKRCRELGIPEDFRTSLHLSWYSRGENAARDRRVELRRVAQTRLAERAKEGKLEVDRSAASQLTELASGALTTSEAKAFLERMPTADQLISPLQLPQLEV
jgi:hypothetical protein